MQQLLRRIGLARADARAWALYDWANSAFYTVIITAVFPIYFQKVAGAELPEGDALRKYSLILGISTGVSGLAAPALGALADYSGRRKLLLGLATALGVLSTAALFLVGPGDWVLASVLLALGNAGMVVALVGYDALLTYVAGDDDVDVLSTTGYGLGYLGGGLLLALALLWIARPAWLGLPHGEGLTPAEETLPVRLAFLATAAWWALFSIPLFLRVKEPPRRIESDERLGTSAAKAAFVRLGETLRELRGYRDTFAMLLAALVYGEGIGTIIKLSVGYASDLDLGQNALISAILLTQFVGIPCAVLYGRMARWIGVRPAIYSALAVYAAACVFAFFLKSERGFYGLALAIGVVQGGAQALSRSLFASLVPAHKSTEFFGFFAFASKLAGFGGPVLFSAVGSAFGNRWAIFVIVGFFVAGGLLLSRVDVAAGRSQARRAEADLRSGYST